MARLIAVTVLEKQGQTDTFDGALTSKNILYAEQNGTDSNIKTIDQSKVQPIEYLVDETFAALTTAINAAASSNNQHVIDVNVSKIDEISYSTPLDRLLQIENIVECRKDPDNPTTKTMIRVWDPAAVNEEIWIVDETLANVITAANA